MPATVARYSYIFILIHWTLVLMGVVLLGLGWYIQYMPPTTPARSYLLDLHMSLGLTSAILLSVQIVLRIVFKPPSFPNEFPKWKQILSYTLYLLIYVSLTLMLISGYLRAVFSGTAIQFWGTPLPVWGVADLTLAGFFGTVHGIVAFVLAGSIFVHVCIGALKHPGIAARTPPLGAPESKELVPGETKFPLASKNAQALAKNLRIFGWIGFWLQFVLAFVAGLLLVIATSGLAFSPSRAGFGDAIYWGSAGFLLLCFAVLLAFYYTRVARKVASRPDTYFSRESRAAFWFLSIGMLTGLFGVVITFTGVALSISLLIAKTVSQPPGIAITNPNDIIRALDVFVLMVNFCLLFGHFIGTGISLWLSISVSKVRIAYM